MKLPCQWASPKLPARAQENTFHIEGIKLQIRENSWLQSQGVSSTQESAKVVETKLVKCLLQEEEDS